MPVGGIQSWGAACSTSCSLSRGHILAWVDIHAVLAAMRAGVAQVTTATMVAAIHRSSAMLRAAGANMEGAVAVRVVVQICGMSTTEWSLQLHLCPEDSIVEQRETVNRGHAGLVNAKGILHAVCCSGPLCLVATC